MAIPDSTELVDKNLEHSIQTQQKLEFYFLALVFTILGFSIQTSQFSTNIQAIFEIMAWFSFLVSGLSGLSRMAWIPVSYKHYSELTEEKSYANEAKRGRSIINESGQLLSNDERADLIKKTDQRITERKNIMEKIDYWHNIKTFLHKWLFIGGIILLIVSRAFNLYLSAPNRSV